MSLARMAEVYGTTRAKELAAEDRYLAAVVKLCAAARAEKREKQAKQVSVTEAGDEF